MNRNEWIVTVFKCKPENVESVLVDFYSFAKDLKGVRDLHFLIRDRVEDEVVFSFRFLVETKDKEAIKSKIAYRLGSYKPKIRFVIDPSKRSSLGKYVAWSPDKRIEKDGKRKFGRFCKFLSQMSRLVVEMARKKYFDSAERQEMAHVMAWMYGIWSLKCQTHGNRILRSYQEQIPPISETELSQIKNISD